MNIFRAKTRVYMGTHDICSVLGGAKRVFIVTDAFMHESGKVNYVVDQLNRSGIQHRIFSKVTPDPDISIVTEGINEIIDFKPDAVVAFGGGSPIDAAKAIVFFAEKVYSLKDCPFVAIPTTSGTGSEVTKFAVISDHEKNMKYPLVDDRLVPNIALLDAGLIVSVPPAVTADTGIDVFTHAIEAYVSKNSNDFSDAMAEKAVKLVYKNLLKAYKTPEDLEARQGMHNASCLAGIAFSNASLGINHSMAHALGANARLPHGRAIGILLPYVMSYNAGCSSDKLSPVATRYAELSRVLDLETSNVRQSALTMIHTVKRFLKQLHMPSTIQAAGVEQKAFEEMLPRMVEAAAADSCTDTTPVPCTKKDFERIYRAAYTGRLI